MGVTATDSVSIANAKASPKVLSFASDEGGKVRIEYIDLTQGAAAGDATSTVELCTLPRGRIRILGKLSNLYCSAFGAARVLNIGTRAYKTIDGMDVAEAANALANNLDVSAAANVNLAAALTLAQSIVWTSQGGITIFGTVAGGTIPAGATLTGWLAYTKD